MEFVNRQAALEAEQSVIGSMLIDPKTVGLVVSELAADDFLAEIDQVLFRTIRRFYLDDRVIDPVTILSELGSQDSAAVRKYIWELMEITPTAANIRAYVKLTKQASKLLRLRALGKELSEVQSEDDALVLLRRAEELISDQGNDDEADMEQCMREFYEDLERPRDHMPWGFPFLDDVLYMGKGRLVVLGGRPSDGKTALALHISAATAQEWKKDFLQAVSQQLNMSACDGCIYWKPLFWNGMKACQYCYKTGKLRVYDDTLCFSKQVAELVEDMPDDGNAGGAIA